MRWTALLIGIGAVAWTRSASADPAACMTAAEHGQKLRAQGKLVDAHKSFLACSATECPPVVAKDCTTWAAEALGATPSIVIDAKDDAGNDVGDAALFIDGALVARQLDGKAIPVDPGSHTIELQRRGSTRHVTHTFIAKEAEKARSIRLTVSAETRSESPPPSTSQNRSVGPWIVMGLGAAAIATGAVLHLTSEYPPNCDPDSNGGICARTPAENALPEGEAEAALQKDRDDATSTRTKKVLGTMFVAGGAVTLVAGAVWLFIGIDRSSRSSRAMIAPWYDVGSGGLMLRSRF